MKRKITQNFKTYQQQRLLNNSTRKSLATWITQAAQEKHIGITPTVKLLIETIDDTTEDESEQTFSEHVLDISNIIQDANQHQDDPDNYHDTNEYLTTKLNE